MKSMKKKAIVLLLAAVLVISSVLVGCGKQEPKESVKETDKTGEASVDKGSEKITGITEEKEVLDPVTLKYYIVGNPDSSPELGLVQDEMNKILKEKINAEISITMIGWGDYSKKMSVMIGAGEEFDLCFTDLSFLNYFVNVSKGAFVDMTDLFPTYAPNLYASLDEVFWDAARVDGRLYGVINQQIFARQAGWHVPKDLVDKTNFDYSNVKYAWDWWPLRDAIAAEDPQAIQPTTALFKMESLASAYNWELIGGKDVPGAIDFTDPKAKVFNYFDAPEFKELVLKAREAQERGYIRPDALTNTENDPTKGGPGYVSTMKPGIQDELARQQAGREVIAIPNGDAVVTTSNVLATMTTISSTSRNPERAMMFLELINTDKELYNLLCNGIEGRHYTKTSDNRIERIADSKYVPNTEWEFGNQYNAYLSGTLADDIWEQTDIINKEAVKSVLLGFSFDPNNVLIQVTNCQAVWNEYIPVFQAGLYDDTETKLVEFNEKLKLAGMDEILVEQQKQIDEFLATKSN